MERAATTESEHEHETGAEPDERPWWRRLSDEMVDRYDAAGLGRAVMKEGLGLARHPLAVMNALTKYAAGSFVAATATAGRLAGARTEGALAPPPRDRRFADKAWEENAVYFGLLQQHLLREKLAQDLVDAAGLEPNTAMKAKLGSQLVIDAAAPSNFLFTNPHALKRALETGGLSLAKGLRNFLDDLRLRE